MTKYVSSSFLEEKTYRVAPSHRQHALPNMAQKAGAKQGELDQNGDGREALMMSALSEQQEDIETAVTFPNAQELGAARALARMALPRNNMRECVVP